MRSKEIETYWLDNESYIESMCYKFAKGDNYLFDDLKSECFFALVDAYDAYDSTKNASFRTFLTFYLIKNIVNFKSNLYNLDNNFDLQIEYLEQEPDILILEDLAKGVLTENEFIIFEKYFIKMQSIQNIIIDLNTTRLRVTRIIDRVVNKLKKVI